MDLPTERRMAVAAPGVTGQHCHIRSRFDNWQS
jgi:hypothetical protein